MGTDSDCLALAACIVRAQMVTPGYDPGNDRYWHTREACVAIGNRLGLSTMSIIAEMRRMDRYDLSREDVEKMSAPFWLEVVHPEIAMEQVMHS